VLVRRKVKVGKTLCSLAPLIGHSYGVQFEVPADGEAVEITTKKARQGPKNTSCRCIHPAPGARMPAACRKHCCTRHACP
jgi:hypothetical protein